MIPIQTFAGCNKKPQQSCLVKDMLFYGSGPNILCTKIGSNKIRPIIIGLNNITTLKEEGSLLLIGDAQGSFQIYDTIKEEIIFKIKCGDSPIETTSSVKNGDSVFFVFMMSAAFKISTEKGIIHKKELDFIPVSALSTVDVLMVGDHKGTLHLFDFDLTLLSTQKLHSDAISDLCFHNKNLVTASHDTLIKIWDSSFAKLDVLKGHTDLIHSVKSTKIGIVSSSADNSILIWNNEMKRMGGCAEKGNGFFNAMVRNSDFLIGQSKTGGFYCYSLEENSKLMYLASGHLNTVTSLDWDGEDFLLSGSLDKTLRIFKNIEIARPMDHGYEITVCKWFKSKEIIFGSNEYIIRHVKPTQIFKENVIGTNNVSWDGTCGENVDIDICEESPYNAVCSELNLTNEDVPIGELGINERLLAINRFSEVAKYYGHFFETSALDVCKNGNGKIIMASANRASGYEWAGMFCWDEKLEFSYYKLHRLGITKLVFSPCGKFLVSGSRDMSVALYDTDALAKHLMGKKGDTAEDTCGKVDCKNDNTEGSLENTGDTCYAAKKPISYTHKRAVTDVGFSFDSRYFGSAGRDSVLFVYSIDGTEKLKKKFDVEVTSIGFSKTRNVVCVGMENGEIELLNYETNTVLKRMLAHGKRVSCIEFSKSGFVSTGGADGMIRVFKED